jgi:hypothetical protein
MFVVEPVFSWEVPVQSSQLVATAMARGRPAAMSTEPPRLNGLSDDVVAERYTELIRLFRALPTVEPRDLTELARLEGSPGTTGFQPWETVVMRSGADDDPAVVAAARSLWEALGSNEYAVHLRSRPNTARGFFAGRAWLDLGVLGMVMWGVVAAAAQDAWGWPWWLFGPVILGWPLLILVIFRRRYNKLRRIGGRELPHF